MHLNLKPLPKKRIKFALISLLDREALGIRYISSALKRAGYSTFIIIFSSSSSRPCLPENLKEEELDELIETLRSIDPSVVCISVQSFTFRLASRISQRIKNELNVFLVWGGVHPSLAPEECIKFVDALCVGEGEIPMLHLADKIYEGRKIDNIPNLWIKKESSVQKNRLEPPPPLDKLPFPDFSDENTYFIGSRKYLLKDKVDYRIIASRGCPFNCTYCCVPNLRRLYRKYGKFCRRRSAKNVIKELIHAKNICPNLKIITFWDDIFPFDERWVKEFSKEYKRKVKLPFRIYLHPLVVNKKNILELRNAGLDKVFLGIQSGSEKIRSRIFFRKESNRRIIKALKLLKRLGVRTIIQLIVDNPFETPKDLRESIQFILKIRHFVNGIHFYSLRFFPKAKLTELALKRKIIDEADIGKKLVSSWLPDTRYFPKMEREERFFLNSLIRLTSSKKIPSTWLLRLSEVKCLLLIKIFNWIYRIFFSRFFVILNSLKLWKEKVLKNHDSLSIQW